MCVLETTRYKMVAHLSLPEIHFLTFCRIVDFFVVTVTKCTISYLSVSPTFLFTYRFFFFEHINVDGIEVYLL